MDMVKPLPRSKAGNRYILVLCNYETRYPKVVPLQSIDAEHMADQGAVFAQIVAWLLLLFSSLVCSH